MRPLRPQLRRRLAPLLLSLAWLWAAAPMTLAQDLLGGGGEPVVLTADELSYDRERRVVTASGNVELSRGERRLLADRLRYDETTNRVHARGNIVLIEATGDAVFGDEMEVTGDLREGFVEGVSALLADDSRMAGARGTRREGNITEVERAVYSPCEVCPEGRGSPLWQIRAQRVIHDQAARTLTYRHAVLEFFGIPVAYTPYFSHPDPTVERKSGFLAPQFGSDTELGLTVQTPYYWTLAPNRDFTFSPLFTTNAGGALAVEARDLQTFGRTILRGSAAYTEEYGQDGSARGDEGLRGNIEGTGRYTIDERHRAGFRLDLASDNTYLRRYNIKNSNILENHAYLERIEDLDYWGLNGWGFQGLRSSDQQDLIPIALPFAVTRLRSGPLQWGSHWTLDASALALTRAAGRDTRRLSTEGGWELPWIGTMGDVWNLRLSLRGDAYQTEGSQTEIDPDGTGESADPQVTGRLLPRATLDWGLPLVGSLGGWQHTLEPVVSLSLAPPGGNDDQIPNEDSLEFEFDETNLLEPDRFPGLDLYEGGSKITWALRFGAFGPDVWNVNGIVGQSVRFTNEQVFPENSGLDQQVSDWVGRLEVRPADWLDVAWRFRLAREDLELARNDVTLGLGPPRLRLNLKYLKLASETSRRDPDQQFGREELIAGVRVQVLDSLALAAQVRRDLNEDEPVTNTYGLVYTHPCLVLVAGLQQDFTEQGELDQPITFTVRLALRNLGQVQAGEGLFGL